MKIIFKGKSKKGKNISLRYPQKGDAPMMLKYINTLSKEKTFILKQGEQLTLKAEKEYLDSVLKKVLKSKEAMLLAFLDNNLVGISSISLKNLVQKHVGTFGISVAKKFRGEGIGTLLMKKVLQEAQKNLPELKIVILEVFANNPLAYNLYKKMGFKKYGILPKSILHRGKYVDAIWMYKKV